MFIHNIRTYEDTCGVMDTDAGNGHGDPSSNPKRSCLHFYSDNYFTLRKVMNAIILPQDLGKIEGHTMLFSLSIATGLGEG